MNIATQPTKIMKTDPMGHIFDLENYPIDDLNDPKTAKLIARCRQELDAVGCAVIRNFVRPKSLERMRQEAESKMDQVYWSQDSHTPYMTKDDASFPQEHPKRFFQDRSSGFVNSDILNEDSDLNQIYDSQVMLDFVSSCIGVSPIYCWADPLGNHPYSIMGEGNYFPWHFDGNDFTVSILVEEPEKGGEFEYAPDIRNTEAENFDKVQAVLEGGREGVHTLPLRPGDMQLFKGRFSLHRVTKVKGRKKRIIALPTYVVDPYTVNRPERAKQFYGRALPIHFEREAHRSDKLTD